MEIGNFWLTLGIKGAEKTLDQLGQAKGKMEGLKETSLQTKAAMLAAFYGLQQVTSAAARHGTELVKYNALTDISAQSVQKWGNAFRQVGVPMQEVMQTMKSLQSDVAKWEMGDAGLSKAFGWMGDVGLEINAAKMRDPEQMMQLAIDYIKREKNVGRRNEVSGMLGLSDNFVQGASRGDFSDAAKNRGGVRSDKMLKTLEKLGVQWDNLEDKITKKMDGFVAKHGSKLMVDVDKIVTALFKLAEAFSKFAEKSNLVELIGKGMEGWTIIFDFLSWIVDKITSIGGGTAGKVVKGITGGALGEMAYDLTHPGEHFERSPMFKRFLNGRPEFGGDIPSWSKRLMNPPQTPPKGGKKEGAVIQNNSFNVGPGQDPQQYADAMQPHLNVAARQMYSNVQQA